jgi:hypothetical protein
LLAAASEEAEVPKDNSALEDFRMFPGILESWELTRTGLIRIREELYKLELWHSYSNPDIPFYVAIYVQENGVWRRMSDPPFSISADGDQALREAMAFLAERLAA